MIEFLCENNTVHVDTTSVIGGMCRLINSRMNSVGASLGCVKVISLYNKQRHARH